jgi:sugar-specific transcriptional regulator TrmB
LVLERFGFTPTENRVYAALLGSGTSTGYALARELGIARANAYQALESLVRRGAARKSATTPAQFTATGPSALVAELERSFRRQLADLEDALLSIPIAMSGTGDELEHLTSPARLEVRAASCVDAARSDLLAVTGPWAPALNDRLASAVARRVQVRVVSLGEPAPPGAILRAVPAEQLAAYWGGSPVAVVADQTRAVFGVLAGERASGVASSAPGIVPFIRHLLRREITAG